MDLAANCYQKIYCNKKIKDIVVSEDGQHFQTLLTDHTVEEWLIERQISLLEMIYGKDAAADTNPVDVRLAAAAAAACLPADKRD